MADEVIPIVETVPTEAQTEAPVESVVVEEAVAPAVETPNPTEVVIEPVLNPAEAVTEPTAQMDGNEPLAPVAEPIAETPEPELQKPTEALLPSVQVAPRSGIRELLVKAQSVIQFRKRKKLDQVMGLFAKRTSVTNDDVEKLLHVSDATATRYLSILEKEGKIKQTGKTGKGVGYIKN